MGDREDVRNGCESCGCDKAQGQLSLVPRATHTTPLLEDLRDTPAVRKHGNWPGAESSELADFIDLMSSHAAERVMTVGDDNYANGGRQKYEAMSEAELRHELVEELLDVINYACMIAIKVIDR